MINYPPCKMACPIQTDAREYIQLIAERRFAEAFASIKRLNPLPRVCGRICPHPCESACKRGQIEAPIAIAALKRFAADGPWAADHQAPLAKTDTGHQVAVVGSGPAGLAAAHDLALLGHQVTIFEALPVLGGMLQLGVPAYRLAKDVLGEEIQAILDLGVKVKTGVKIGEKITLSELLDTGYGAVFVAIGAHSDRRLGIPGEQELEGVVSAVSFLRAVNQGDDQVVGKKAAVVGGGNTAVDSARTLRRLGAETVHIVYRRSRDEMPAASEEIEEAIDEGIDMAYLTSPVKIHGENGWVVALECVKNALGKPDESGRRRPEPMAGSEFSLDVDMVVAAVGQAPDSVCLGDGAGFLDKRQMICVKDFATMETNLPGVFAGGDAVTGPATAIKAIAAGKQAAVSIDRYLKGEPLPGAKASQAPELPKLPDSIVEKTRSFERAHKDSLQRDDRLAGFDEVERVYPEQRAVQEALRCLHCYLNARVDQEKCIACLTCVRVCPLGIPTFGKMGEIAIDPFQCQACGMCVVECPVQAIDIGLDSRRDLTRKLKARLDPLDRPDPSILVFFDLHGDFDSVEVEDLKKDFPNVLPLMVFGVRRIDVIDILNAFYYGADAVLIAMCSEDRDPFPEVREKVKARAAWARTLLEAAGISGDRLEVCNMSEKGLLDKNVVNGLVALS